MFFYGKILSARPVHLASRSHVRRARYWSVFPAKISWLGDQWPVGIPRRGGHTRCHAAFTLTTAGVPATCAGTIALSGNRPHRPAHLREHPLPEALENEPGKPLRAEILMNPVIKRTCRGHGGMPKNVNPASIK